MVDFLEGHLLLVNKPLRWTSFDAVKKIRNTLRTHLQVKKIKVGHAGTLDPLADGLLIVCTGKFTKRINDFQSQEKEYTGKFILGATTPSFDLETEVDKTYPIDHITENDLKDVAHSLTGEILQQPPIYSAIKQNGKRLYEHARKGESVKIKERLVNVSEFEITKVELPTVYFRIVCSKGTYIRSLAHSFGEKLKSGAYLGQLTRTRIGNFELSQAVEIQEFIDSFSHQNNKNALL
ncbi:tRNA pseudouridine(55) synthase TruB [Flavobacteriales bacterium]|jgi:tRNA pseudouridine55 synthase|nr:tRNA pseudouridine(55) synthase TruB [Flavobacteriales bacterium]